jgi:hypothetical protein
MPTEPLVKPLSRTRRQFFLVFLILFFCSALPLFIIYATGYRFDFVSIFERPIITATGGIYITTATEEAQIFANENEVTDARTFRNATYLQWLEAGVHRVHVQAPGTATWVKELNVLPHIVIEVESFNMPVVPHVRLVTPYTTSTGLPVVVTASTTSVPFSFATITSPFLSTTSRATSTLIANREYQRLSTLFADKASTTALREELLAAIAEGVSATSTRATTSATTTAFLAVATTTIITDDVMLYERGGEVYVKALGTGRDIPAYFCAIDPQEAARVTAEAERLGSATSSLQQFSEAVEFAPGDIGRQCRTDIRMDRLGQRVVDFMFMPGNTNLVLMHLERGLYVIEVDDRAWQNAQLLYPGEDMAVLVDDGRIYASSTAGVVEVFTEIPAN